MSLINEALKRAKEAQEKAPPSDLSMPHLRPAEPAPTIRRSVGLLVPIALTLVALGGLFLLWQAAPNYGYGKTANPPSQTSPTAVRSWVPRPALAPTAAAPVPAVRAGGAAAPAGPAQPLSTAVTGPTTNAPVPTVLADKVTAVASTSSSGAATNAAAPPAPAKPAPLRLQAIVYNPVHPSAIIGGKTLFVGDRIGESRVLAISQESATLVGAGRTNVLSLSE